MASCPHGYEDGEIRVYDDDGTERMRLCGECARERNRAEFRGDYSAAGLSAKARFRRCQRRRARRSAVKRRQLAKGKPPRRRERTTPLALGRAYPKVWQLTAADLERLDKQWCDTNDRPFDRRGFKTRLLIYQWAFTRYRACGQDFEFKNADVQAYLAEHGRPRGRRAVQYERKRLEALGVFSFEWVKRGTWRRDRGWCMGEKRDTIRATALHIAKPRANCTLPTGAGASASMPRHSCSPDPKTGGKSPPNTEIPPAPPADDEPASAGNDESPEIAELRRAITFAEARIAAGWSSERGLVELRRLRQALRLELEGPSP